MKLTDTKLRNLKPGEKPIKVSDGRGLYLLVTPDGSKRWRWKYRFLGKEKTMTFGPYPEVSLLGARDRLLEARRLLLSGTDPMAERQQEKQRQRAARDTSFASVARAHHAKWAANKEAKYVARILEAWERDVFPCIGHKPISTIEAGEIRELVQNIEARGAEDTARRLLGKINEVFRYAMAHNLATHNPAASFKPSDILKPVEVLNFARVEDHELPDLLRKIEIYRGSQRVRLGLKLLAHTFLRTHELLGGRWLEVDFRAAEWRIPPERMKTIKNAKFKAPHIVPLATQTLEILEQLYALTGEGDLMFPGEWDRSKPLSNNTFLQALYRMGYKGLMTGHGFRGIASTVLHEHRSDHHFEHEHIELQLAHLKRNDESAAYDYSKYLRERREMMQWWADYLEKAQKDKSKRRFVA